MDKFKEAMVSHEDGEAEDLLDQIRERESICECKTQHNHRLVLVICDARAHEECQEILGSSKAILPYTMTIHHLRG